jgi:hypothetical protein
VVEGADNGGHRTKLFDGSMNRDLFSNASSPGINGSAPSQEVSVPRKMCFQLSYFHVTKRRKNQKLTWIECSRREDHILNFLMMVNIGHQSDA